MTRPWAAACETHTGAVFFAGERAYKVKKPVEFGFCDFTGLQARELACRREVELNRRLAPDVYLGVAELHLPDGHGTEPVVVMRRMPASTRLAARVADRAVEADQVRAIAAVLAAFHDRCDTGPSIAAEATVEALRGRWRANLDELAAVAGPILAAEDLEAVDRDATAWIAGRGALLAARIADGRIVDGHGDLLADDIFLLPDGPRILDCLEFDDRLRYLDRLDDVAFLAMDLERIGAPDLAATLVSTYRELAADTAPASLVHHYVAYRAMVRAKVACHRHRQGDPEAADGARHLTALARRHLHDGQSRLVLVGGLPGTGKSTLARALAEQLGATVLATDLVRKEMAGLAPDASAAADFGEDLYAAARKDEVYEEVMRRAADLLSRGHIVVLDATWSAQRHRESAAQLAAMTYSTLAQVRCVAPAEVAAARMRGRIGPSDANPAIAAALAAQADPWDDATDVDTSGSLERACAAALAAATSNDTTRTCAPC